jgi:hypothetical protein
MQPQRQGSMAPDEVVADPGRITNGLDRFDSLD